jgi:recombination protein RecR
MSKFPSSIQNLINEFNKLPGIGPKTAEKLVLYLLKQPKEELARFAEALINVKSKLTVCAECQNIAEKNPCAICADSKRDRDSLCVVAEPQDMIIIESTGDYKGLYHILGGTLNTLEGIMPDQLKIKELENRIKNPPVQKEKESPLPPFNKGATNPPAHLLKGAIKEVILALNPDMEGETTILYLTKILKPYKIKITRLARGLPMGSDLEYADEATLSNALKGRREI